MRKNIAGLETAIFIKMGEYASKMPLSLNEIKGLYIYPTQYI